MCKDCEKLGMGIMLGITWQAHYSPTVSPGFERLIRHVQQEQAVRICKQDIAQNEVFIVQFFANTKNKSLNIFQVKIFQTQHYLIYQTYSPRDLNKICFIFLNINHRDMMEAGQWTMYTILGYLHGMDIFVPISV